MTILLTHEILNIQTFNAAAWYIEKNLNATYLQNESNKDLLKAIREHYPIDITHKANKGNFTKVNISIDHERPWTCVGTNQKALFFPKRIIELYYKNFDEKSDKVLFRGILTRKRVIESILFCFSLSAYKEAITILINVFLFRKEFSINSDKLKIIFTKQGRRAKTKFLNKDYFEELRDYKFIYCPAGDFDWTYRFFETIMVGSIPITEVETSLFEGFYKQSTPEIDFPQTFLITNLSLCKERFVN